jgi:hypothetical protein
MSNKETTMNNRKDHHNILHAILRMLVCLMLLMACVPVAGETVHAATTYTAQGKLVLSASKKKGVEQEDSDMPGDVDHFDGLHLDEGYQFTTDIEGTLTLVYTAKNIPQNNCIAFRVYDANTEERVMYSKSSPKETGSTSASNSVSKILSPGTYVISSFVLKQTSATLSVYFLPTVNSITLPDMTLQTGDSVSLKDVLTTDPTEYLAYCKSQAVWTSDNENVAAVDTNGKVTAKVAGMAQITMENPDGTTASCTITVLDSGTGTSITPTTVQLSKESYTYSGKENKPTVTILDQDGNAIPSDLVTVKYSNNINAGTAKVLVTVNASTITQEDGSIYSYHSATLTKTYTIKAATAKKVTVPKTSVSYKLTGHWEDNSHNYFEVDGQTPQKVTVYDSKGKKIDASNYTVSYSSTKHAGKVTVTVKLNKNYGKKRLTTSYTIKVNSKTTKLFPKRTYYKYTSDTSASYSYTKMSAKNLKKLLPYGDKDVEQDIVSDTPAYTNRTLYREIEDYTEQWGDVQSLKFTGTIGDLIQCCVQGKVSEIKDCSSDPYKKYKVICEDGTEYYIMYNNMLGLKSGYKMVWIWGSCQTVYAYIKP